LTYQIPQIAAKPQDVETQLLDAQKINFQLNLRLEENSARLEQMLQYQLHLEQKLLAASHEPQSPSLTFFNNLLFSQLRQEHGVSASHFAQQISAELAQMHRKFEALVRLTAGDGFNHSFFGILGEGANG
jgi:hypothetical protein